MRHGRKYLALVLLTILLAGSLLPLRAGAEPPHTHAWSEWVSDPSAPAGCTSGGREMRTCSAENCPEPVQYRDTGALGHSWGEWQVRQAAGCTYAGVNWRSCKRCGAEETMQTPSLGGHSFGGWSAGTPATCTGTGSNQRSCTRCGETEHQSTPALGHDWEHKAKAPTCTDVGVEEDVCRRCGAAQNTIVTAALGHSWGLFSQTLAPTCGRQGSEETVCTRCGLKWTRAVPALEHQWGGYHTKTEAACATPGVEARSCSLCGQEQLRVLAALGHSWGQPVASPAATCQASGLAVTSCQRCGQSYSTALPRIRHIYGEWSLAVAPTCTQRGTEMRACTMCGRQETRRLKALGHQSDEVWVTVRQPSLGQRGLQATGCLRCGEQARTRTFAPRGYRYEVPTQAFGPLAAQLDSALASSGERLIPLDLSVAGEVRVPLVTADGYLIGSALIAYAPGSVTVKLEAASEPTRLREKTLHIYSGPEEAARAAYGAQSLPFDVPVKVEGDKALVSISLSANYYQGNENKRFHEEMLMPGSQSSYADLARQMAEEIARLWAAQ